LFSVLSIGANAAKSEFFFVQIADTQLGFTTQNKDLGPDIANFEKAVESINRLKPAFVVISGDMTNAANDPAQTSAFLNVVKKIKKGIGVFLVAGNHDMYTATKEDIANYQKSYGKDYYSFNCRGSKFIVLDSLLLWHKTADPIARTAQRTWFEEQLKSAKRSNHIFVFTHHPWFLDKPDEADAYWTVPLAHRNDYLGLMEKYGVDFAVAGHYHREALGHAGKLTMTTTAPMAVPMGPEPVGFKVFKVYKDRVEFQYYGLQQIPEKIEL
jgi:predicted MPP superfamily phosphohydrolase